MLGSIFHLPVVACSLRMKTWIWKMGKFCFTKIIMYRSETIAKIQSLKYKYGGFADKPGEAGMYTTFRSSVCFCMKWIIRCVQNKKKQQRWENALPLAAFALHLPPIPLFSIVPPRPFSSFPLLMLYWVTFHVLSVLQLPSLSSLVLVCPPPPVSFSQCLLSFELHVPHGRPTMT